MSLKNRLSTVEVRFIPSRNNSTISPPTSRPTSDKPKPSARPRMPSKRPLMPKTQTSEGPSPPNLTASTNNCTPATKQQTTPHPPQELELPHQEPTRTAQHIKIKFPELPQKHPLAALRNREASRRMTSCFIPASPTPHYHPNIPITSCRYKQYKQRGQLQHFFLDWLVSCWILVILRISRLPGDLVLGSWIFCLFIISSLAIKYRQS